MIAEWPYGLESGFLEMILQSEHRTLNPEEAGGWQQLPGSLLVIDTHWPVARLACDQSADTWKACNSKS